MRAKYITAGLVVLIIIAAAVIIKIGSSVSGPTQGATADPVLGATTAQLTIQEYSDFECPYCNKAHSLLEQLVKEYGDKVKLVYNDFPLTTVHQNALPAAIAGQCALATSQEKFWEYHDVLFVKQASWSALSDPTEQFITYADQLSLDHDTFASCLNNKTPLASIEEDQAEGDAARINSTPTLFVGDERVVGITDYASLKAVVDKHLQ